MPHEIAMERGDYFFLPLRPAENLAGPDFADFGQTQGNQSSRRGYGVSVMGGPETRKAKEFNVRAGETRNRLTQNAAKVEILFCCQALTRN
jgi:hypothetical protein